MTPMMLGLLVTSTTSGFLISRYGRYRAFPIVGTAIAAVGLYLLSTLEVGTATEVAAGYMLLLGLGLGLVMQVLVLAAQNAVDYRLLGVATSGATLFRQVGGSIGVSVFGAIFTNQLGRELAQSSPARRTRAREREPRCRPAPAARDPRDVHHRRRRRASPGLPHRCRCDGRGVRAELAAARRAAARDGGSGRTRSRRADADGSRKAGRGTAGMPPRRSGREARAGRGSCGDDDDREGGRREVGVSISIRTILLVAVVVAVGGGDRVDQERPAPPLRLRLRCRRPLAGGDRDGAAPGLEPARVLDSARAGRSSASSVPSRS